MVKAWGGGGLHPEVNRTWLMMVIVYDVVVKIYIWLHLSNLAMLCLEMRSVCEYSTWDKPASAAGGAVNLVLCISL